MSLPHFPSYWFEGDYTVEFVKKEIEEWKLDHKKLDAEREKELKETTLSYLALFKTNTKNYEEKEKLKKTLKKQHSKQKEFFEWLESSVIPLNYAEWRKTLEEKKKSLLEPNKCE